MNNYELMYIIDAAYDETLRKELIERTNKLITDNSGTLDKVDEWGKRRLAYPINYKNEGYYVLVNFSANPDLPKEIERVLQINENVLRYMIIKIEEKHTHVKPRQNPVRPQYGRPYDNSQPPLDVEAPAAAPAPEAKSEEAVENLVETVQVETTTDAPATEEGVENLVQTVKTEASENNDA